jgi:hypothetical protein
MSDTRPTRDVTQPRPNPNAVWKCGLTDQGLACSDGPDQRGRCCRLTLANHSGSNQPATAQPCEGCVKPLSQFREPALPACIPVRNSWRFRHSLSISLGVLTGSVLLVMLALPEREAAFVPGSLSGKHAQIISSKVVSERCGLCHPNSHSTEAQANPALTQDELCSRCHIGQHKNIGLRSPHDLDRASLQRMSNERRERRGRLVSFSSSGSGATEPDSTSVNSAHRDVSNMITSCASCHVEHHGRNQDLQAMADQRCQACHQSQFASFNEGHPEFADYPQARNRRIAFSHRNHQDKHFSQKNQTFECAGCHVDTRHQSGVGSVFRTVSFEVACANCHNEPIKASTADGWTVLQLPSIQADALEPNLSLSDWPNTAQFGYEGVIPLPMRTLLLADEDAIDVVQKIPGSGSLKDLPGFADDGKSATLTVAKATRKLIKDIANEGQLGWQKRLSRILREALGQHELGPNEMRLINELCAGLPPDLFRQIERDWFKSVSGIARRDNDSTTLTMRLTSAHQEDDLLLSGSELKNDSRGRLDEAQSTDAKQLSPENDLLLDFTKPQSSNPTDSLEDFPTRPKLTKVRGTIHVVQGGWYLDNETLSLRYMPRGHADRTFAAWAELSAILQQSHKKGIGSAATNASLPNPAATNQMTVAGGCAVCHNLEHQDVAQQIVNGDSVWVAYNRPPTVRELTKFDHTPHLILPTLAKCTYCHQLDEEKKSDYRRFVSTQSQSPDIVPQVTCEFKSISLQQCVACHRPNGAGTGCVQCHNYHVSEPAAAK